KACHYRIDGAMDKKDTRVSFESIRGLFTYEQTRSTIPLVFDQFEKNVPSWNTLKQMDLLKRKDVKIVYWVRHAEGYHNAAERLYGTETWDASISKLDEYLDASLNEFGMSDAYNRSIAMALERQDGMPLDRIIVSPLKRTLQTAHLIFRLNDTQSSLPIVPIVAMESCRETLGVHTCDKRSQKSVMMKAFPKVDWSLIENDEDILWTSHHRETNQEIQFRCHQFLNEMFDTFEDKHIAVVSHAGFIQNCMIILNYPDYKPTNCETIPTVIQRTISTRSIIAKQLPESENMIEMSSILVLVLLFLLSCKALTYQCILPSQRHILTRYRRFILHSLTLMDESLFNQDPVFMSLHGGFQVVPGHFNYHTSADPNCIFEHFTKPHSSWHEFTKIIRNDNRPNTKVLYFLRHAEGEHNAAKIRLGSEVWFREAAITNEYLDARLTEKGEIAAKFASMRMKEELNNGMPLEKVILSPLRRTLQTGTTVFSDQIGKIPFVAMELCRETMGVHTCDKRSRISEMKSLFPMVDFSDIANDEDCLWQSDVRESLHDIQTRAVEFLRHVYDNVPETFIAITSHVGFIGAFPWNNTIIMGQAATRVREKLRATTSNDTLPTTIESNPVAQLAANKSPLYMEDQIAPGADWHDESLSTYVRRFLGALPESETERRKRQQKHALFVPGVHSQVQFQVVHEAAVIELKAADIATRKIQTFLRRCMYRRRWKEIVGIFLLRLREQARLEKLRDEEANTLCRFREILINGFSATKVSARGRLKNVQMKLVIDDKFEECYLTWTPSVKKDPRLMIRLLYHFSLSSHSCVDLIDKVVPVKKTENENIPSSLLRKINYRRSLIIYGRSILLTKLPLRTILQIQSSKERDLLVKGFTQFLNDSTYQTFMDQSGVLRKDKRRASITYFRPQEVPPQPKEQLSALERLERAEKMHLRGRASNFGMDLLSDDEDEARKSSSNHSEEDTAAIHPIFQQVEEKEPPPLLKYYTTRYDDMEVEEGAIDTRIKPPPPASLIHARMEEEEASLSYLFESLVR
ncbi:phosphoglycerate mutase family, partial [Thraustotheca clavata]